MEILGKDYTVRYNLRSMLVYEQITEKPFEVITLTDQYILLYACIVSVKDNPSLDFEEFIDYCSDHTEVMDEFLGILAEENKKRSMMGDKKKETENNLV